MTVYAVGRYKVRKGDVEDGLAVSANSLTPAINTEYSQTIILKRLHLSRA